MYVYIYKSYVYMYIYICACICTYVYDESLAWMRAACSALQGPFASGQGPHGNGGLLGWALLAPWALIDRAPSGPKRNFVSPCVCLAKKTQISVHTIQHGVIHISIYIY